MGILNINDLRDGMVLAQGIKNRHGNMLLVKGRTLTKKDIFILKTWAVSYTHLTLPTIYLVACRGLW